MGHLTEAEKAAVQMDAGVNAVYEPLLALQVRPYLGSYPGPCLGPL